MTTNDDEERFHAGWYTDAANAHSERYYDGIAWTDRIRSTAAEGRAATASTGYAAGWYPDTTTSGTERYFDGAGWTHQTRSVVSSPAASSPGRRRWPWKATSA